MNSNPYQVNIVKNKPLDFDEKSISKLGIKFLLSLRTSLDRHRKLYTITQTEDKMP